MAGGDTDGSLFGSTRNPYDLDRTVGGSSGGSAAAVAANFCTAAIGQEGLASIRRPAAWNSIAGIRTTAGLVSRGGVYSGWPATAGSLGPMARTIRDMEALLDVIAGYDPEDPLTAYGFEHMPESFMKYLDKDGLKGARFSASCESRWVSTPSRNRKISKKSAKCSTKASRSSKRQKLKSSIRSLFPS